MLVDFIRDLVPILSRGKTALTATTGMNTSRSTEVRHTTLIFVRNLGVATPFLGISLLLGFAQAWANRFYMGNDGISYLDMAGACLRGDWHAAINGSWNPLYAWLIGLEFFVLHPSAYWEYPAVQALNFVIYVIALVSFQYFLSALKLDEAEQSWKFHAIAYAIFLWSALILIRVDTVNADMLVAASFYAASGALLRAANYKNQAAVANSGILGLWLAIGYYSKAAMFPLSLILLFIAWIELKWRYALIASVVFCLLSAPLIVALSDVTGHLTIGDTGRLNYSWYVNGVALRWWQGGPEKAGQPLHPPRILLDSPRVYEFGGVFPQVTYPMWYDFAYWYQGLRVWIDPLRLLDAIRANLKVFLKFLILEGGGFLLGWLACFLFAQKKKKVLHYFVSTWIVWAPSLSAVILYSAVYIEPRYIGAFMSILLIAGFAAVPMDWKPLSYLVSTIGLLWAICFSSIAPHLYHAPWQFTPVNASWIVADNLEKLGLHPNEQVASVCYSNRQNVLWARLAKAHIVAETDWNVDFWQLSANDQRRVLAAEASTGAVFAVSDTSPPDPSKEVGWERIGNTNFSVYSLANLKKSATHSDNTETNRH